jgi:Nucleotidyl transferase of unknown function (DUF2204)
MERASNGLTLEPQTIEFYRRVIDMLNDAGLQFLVGGAYALERYTGIARHTKDFDIFVRPRDREQVLRLLELAGYATEVTFSHWLAKVRMDDDVVDVIFSSGNGVACVDDEWFAHALHDRVLDRRVRICPVEETIWSKAFIMERERFDGADVAHLLRVKGPTLDWARLIRRFGPRWRVLLAHLTLFGFIYPCERSRIPPSVMRELADRLAAETDARDHAERVCHGPILSRSQYLIDIECWGYADPRLAPLGAMTDLQVQRWTRAAFGEAA